MRAATSETGEHRHKLAYSMEEACSASGIGRTFIFNAIRERKLTAIKAGSRTLIPEDSLRAFLGSLPAIIPRQQKPRAT